MESCRLAMVGIVAVLTAALLSVAGWGARDALVARRCLEGELHPEVFNGASITEDACVIGTASGPTVRVALDGPSFPTTLAAAGGAMILALVLLSVIYRASRST